LSSFTTLLLGPGRLGEAFDHKRTDAGGATFWRVNENFKFVTERLTRSNWSQKTLGGAFRGLSNGVNIFKKLWLIKRLITMKEPTDGSGFVRNCFQIKVRSTCLKCWLRHIDLAECSFVCTPFKEKGKGKTVAVAVAASSKQVVAVTIGGRLFSCCARTKNV
jgi:hypothetical protein